MRYDDFDNSTVDILTENLQPVLDAAVEDAKNREQQVCAFDEAHIHQKYFLAYLYYCIRALRMENWVCCIWMWCQSTC